jgi:TusA-related sulfurtransferase
MTPLEPQRLDLRRTKCPLNFVKARLAAEKLVMHESLEVWLEAEGESALNIPNSLKQEGYIVTLLSAPEGEDSSTLVLQIQKPSPKQEGA